MFRRFTCLVATAALFGTSPARAWQTSYFEHDDERYLLPKQHQGGAALLPPSGEEAALPVVVFLHGTNETGALHMWFGGKDRDVRPVVQRLVESRRARPFILAAPSQTRHAAVPRALWSGFELGAFIDDTANALSGKAQIDRARVYVVGHSGAGCNPNGGVASRWATQALQPVAVASIDPCLDAEMGAAMARRPTQVPLSVWWQAAVWPRSPGAFWTSLTRRKPPERVDRLLQLKVSGPTAHDDVVPLALEQFLSEWLPSAATKS